MAYGSPLAGRCWSWSGLGLVALLALVAPAGCERATPDYCCTNLATCREADGTAELEPCAGAERTFCDNSGQFAASLGVGRTCIPEPGGRSCDAPADCPNPQAPVCDLPGTQTCVGCREAGECTGFPDRPQCNPTSGACVECIAPADCPAQRPLCDPDGVCRECAVDTDCTSQLCNQVTGSCVPEDDVLYVGQGGTGDQCLRTETCGSIQQAIDLVSGTRTNIHVSSGSYVERITIDGVSFYLSSAGAELRSPAGEIGPLVTITGAATVSDSIRLRDALGAATGDGLECTGTAATFVTLRRVLIEDSAAFGVESNGCRLDVLASTIDGNAGGGLQITGGDVVLQNNFVTRNGGPSASFGGVALVMPATMAVELNTVADNVANPGAAAGIRCASLVPRIVTSNIVFGVAPLQVEAAGCDFIYTMSNEAIQGTGNVLATPLFVDAMDGDYHLAAGSEGIDDADPAVTVTTDVDGDLRPRGPARDIGADEVTP